MPYRDFFLELDIDDEHESEQETIFRQKVHLRDLYLFLEQDADNDSFGRNIVFLPWKYRDYTASRLFNLLMSDYMEDKLDIEECDDTIFHMMQIMLFGNEQDKAKFRAKLEEAWFELCQHELIDTTSFRMA